MTEETKLEDALSGAEKPAEPAKVETPAEPVEAEKPKDEPKGTDGNITVPLAALHAERDARQKLAGELDQIKAQIVIEKF